MCAPTAPAIRRGHTAMAQHLRPSLSATVCSTHLPPLNHRSTTTPMKSMNRLRLLGALLALSCAGSVRAQYAPPPPARPFPGFANEKLRSENVYMSAWGIGASYRLRFEDKLGAGFTDAGSNWDFSKRPVDDNNNSYLISRL